MALLQIYKFSVCEKRALRNIDAAFQLASDTSSTIESVETFETTTNAPVEIVETTIGSFNENVETIASSRPEGKGTYFSKLRTSKITLDNTLRGPSASSTFQTVETTTSTTIRLNSQMTIEDQAIIIDM